MNSRGAKLAHQRSSNDDNVQRSRFTFTRVLNIVVFRGEKAAVVEIDDTGEVGMVGMLFVRPSGAEGGWEPSLMACPVVYCKVSRARAIDAYQQFSAQHQQAV